MEKVTENNEIVLFETEDHEVKLSVPIDNETVWLTQAQMKELFNVDRTVITKHINNIFKEDELDEKSNVQILHIANSDRPVINRNKEWMKEMKSMGAFRDLFKEEFEEKDKKIQDLSEQLQSKDEQLQRKDKEVKSLKEEIEHLKEQMRNNKIAML